jgi:hypothetical protein
MSEFWVILSTCIKLVTVCDVLLGRGRSNSKTLCPDLNHIVPEVGTKRFHRGTNNGSQGGSPIGGFGVHVVVAKIDKTEGV